MAEIRPFQGRDRNILSPGALAINFVPFRDKANSFRMFSGQTRKGVRGRAPQHTGSDVSKMPTKPTSISSNASKIDLKSLKTRAQKIIQLLKRSYPDAKCSLNHSNAFELLIATILSAQCTDERVNIVTADLFRKYRKAQDYLKVSPTELQKDIRTTGFFRNKAKAIQGTAKVLHEQYAGHVPRTIEELLELPGVARKTANVVLGNAFGVISGIVVDTHVTRLSRRLALTQQGQAGKIEKELIEIAPRKDWVMFSHLLIAHGRKICKARNPLCAECVVEKLCPSSYLKTGVKPES